MKARWMALVLALLVVGVPALAADWIRNCDLAKNEVVETLRPGEWACANPTALGEKTEMLSGIGCDNMDFQFAEDLAGVGDDDVALQSQYCAARTDASGDSPTDAGFSPTGFCSAGPLLSAAGTDRLVGIGLFFTYSEVTTIVNDQPRLVASCH